MPTSADLLLDTSAALALLHDQNTAHEQVHQVTRGRVLGLAGHAMFETFSVLTRLPGTARVSAERARQLIAHEFTGSVALAPADALRAVATFTAAGVAGGSVHDGLVGLAAKAAGIPLLTCDRRAMGTYAALKVDVRLV